MCVCVCNRHGVKQPRHPWSDGPEYITQCPIRPGTNFTQQIDLSDEIGTLWWHAHSDWSRATVHGLLVVYPQLNDTYPFPMPFAQVPLLLGTTYYYILTFLYVYITLSSSFYVRIG